MSRQIDLVRRHSKKFEEALERAKAELASVDPHAESVGGGADSDRVVDALRSGHTESMAPADALAFDRLEATVLDRLRPAYYILEDKVQIKGKYDHVDVLRGNLSELERISKSVGRLDLVHHRTLSYAGTGWLIEKDVAVTNRHVAQIFAQPSWSGGFEFREGAFGETMESRLNYIRQHVSGDLKRRADVLEVLYVAGPGEPDFALLKVATHAETAPLEFFEAPLRSGRPVAAVGYPAWDGGRNDKELMEELFDSVYDVKRFSPGVLTGTTSEGIVILARIMQEP